MPQSAIRAENLVRTYRKKKGGWFKKAEPENDFVALAGVSIDVPPGELFGVLGPNGAGKTTLIKILTTLLAPTSGQAWVLDHDVVAEAETVRPLINMVSGGETSGYGMLTVRENLWLFGRIYGIANKVLAERIDKMLAVVGLEDKAKSRVSHLSTGQRQKMNFCRGFVTNPTVLFLDEPTLGLDVNAARTIRSFIKEWMAEDRSRTMLLTTHYMAEADELCDRLAIIDGGKVLACDTPKNLKKRVQEFPIFELHLAPGAGDTSGLALVPGVHNYTREDTPDMANVKVALSEDAAIGPAVSAVVAAGGKIMSLRKTEPTLEDVFIELVGRSLRE